MWQIIGAWSTTGVTVFLTTQYLEEADQLADRIAVIDGGLVVAEGTPAELKKRVAEQRLDLTLSRRRRVRRDRRPARRPGRPHATRTRSTLGVATDGSAAHIRALLDEVDPDRRAVSHLRGAHGHPRRRVPGPDRPPPPPEKETADV